MYGVATTFACQGYKSISSFTIKNSNIFKKKSLNIGTSLQSYSTYNSPFFTFKIKQLSMSDKAMFSRNKPTYKAINYSTKGDFSICEDVDLNKTIETYINKIVIESGNISVDLLCPAKPKKNPLESKLNGHLITWLINTIKILPNKDESIEKFKGIKIDLLASTTFPYLTKLDDLLAASKWLSFLFFHDDLFEGKINTIENIKKIHKNFSNILINPNMTQNSYSFLKDEKNHVEKIESILSDVVNYLFDKKEYDSFCVEVQNYFVATEKEYKLKALLSQTSITVETIDTLYKKYDEMRIYSGSVYSLWALGSCLINIEFKLESLNMNLKELGRLANCGVCLANDIYSETKEKNKNTFSKMNTINKIFILEKRGESRCEAIKVVESEHNEIMKSFILEKKEYINSYTMEKKNLLFIEMMECWIYGNHEWSINSKRYPGITQTEFTKMDTL